MVFLDHFNDKTVVASDGDRVLSATVAFQGVQAQRSVSVELAESVGSSQDCESLDIFAANWNIEEPISGRKAQTCLS